MGEGLVTLRFDVITLFPEIFAAVTQSGITRRALERGISVAPGPIFSAGGRFENHLRLNAGVVWSERIEHSLEVLADIVKEQSV